MWSLSVEEQFYLVWPAVLFIALRASRKKAIIACIVGMAISLVLRIAFYHGISDLSRIFYGTDTVGDDLLAGCSAPSSSGRQPLRKRPRCVAPCVGCSGPPPRG